MSETSAPIRQALRDALPGAMTARDTPARNAIRSALAAIENAEAVVVETPADGAAATSEHFAGTAIGVGAAETPRRELDEDHTLEIVSVERDERLAAAAEYRARGEEQRAAELEAEAAALDAFLC
ncbi:MAG: hypothetical protein QM619_13235 [Micropruina sp.]|uniref:hypothetical protein n=1 Tax=Micropruina sp. TaxID=2737536 RepID=UPI0039E55830